jgi:hypothetical protein
MLHIKSVIPKIIDKIKLKEGPEADAVNKNQEKTNKNTPDVEVFLNSKKKKQKSVKP